MKTMENIPPPPSHWDVKKIQAMLEQVQFWINKGDSELVKKHWQLISQECKKFGNEE